MHSSEKVIALEARLKLCRNVLCLGVLPNFSDYSPDDAELIRRAAKIYYPSTFYADMFSAMGKSIFPSIHTYRFVQDKIKQTALFSMLDIPCPRTRIFYGRGRKEKILRCFSFPFVGKIPRGSAMGRGVFLLRTSDDLDQYCQLTKTAYIQNYLPIDRDIRAVVIGDRVVHAYWRVARAGEFRSNVGLGAEIRLDSIPEEALALAIHTARRCGWNDVGLDICRCQDRYYVLEANMKYGREGFRRAGIDYIQLMETLIENKEI